MNTAQLLKAARENRAAALDKVKALSEKIEKRTWDEATDGPALDAAKNELDTADTEVRRLETMLDIEARSAGWTSSATTDTPLAVNVVQSRGDRVENIRGRFRFANALKAVVSKAPLAGLEKEMHEEAIAEMRAAGVSNYGSGVLIPVLLQERDMVAGTTTAGGFTIQTDIGRLIPFLDPRPVVRRMGATFLPDLRGNIDFPRNDAAATAVWATEQAASTETSPTFDRVQMSPKRLTGFTEVSMQIMRQSEIVMENFVRERLLNARDNALDIASLNGTGSSGQPLGIPGVSGVNLISIAASPTWAKIVDFETQIAIDNADFGNLSYLTTPAIAGLLKTKEKASNTAQFIWMGPNNGQGSINGYNAYVSSLVPIVGGAHYMYFGNWRKLMIGQWGGLEITTDPYTRLKEATLQVVLNTWHDVAVEHGPAFSFSSSVHPS